MIRCCQSILTLTLSMPCARSLWITCSVMPMLRMRIFIAGSEFLCSRKSLTPSLFARAGARARAAREPRPGVGVRRLERVVVALDPGPDDEVRAELACEIGGFERQPPRPRPRRGIWGDEPAAAEARIEMEPARDAVDAVAAERLTHRVDVVGRELLRIVELVLVDQLAEPLDRAADPFGRRLV